MKSIEFLIVLFLFVAVLMSACADGRRQDTTWECENVHTDISFTFKERDLFRRMGNTCYSVTDTEGYERSFCMTGGNWSCKGKINESME